MPAAIPPFTVPVLPHCVISAAAPVIPFACPPELLTVPALIQAIKLPPIAAIPFALSPPLILPTLEQFVNFADALLLQPVIPPAYRRPVTAALLLHSKNVKSDSVKPLPVKPPAYLPDTEPPVLLQAVILAYPPPRIPPVPPIPSPLIAMLTI